MVAHRTRSYSRASAFRDDSTTTTSTCRRRFSSSNFARGEISIDHPGNRQNFLKVSSSATSRDLKIKSAWGDDVQFFPCALVKKPRKVTAKGDLYSLSIGGGNLDDMMEKFSTPGQYVQMKVLPSDKPAFIAVANGPGMAKKTNSLEFLVKRPSEGYTDKDTGEVLQSTAQKVCDLDSDEASVLVSAPMGKGFRLPEDEIGDVLCFAAGSGISPVKSFLEEEGFTHNGETYVFYGTRDAAHTAFAEELKTTMGGRAKIVNAYSADGNGYAQDYFKRMIDSGELKLKDPKKAIAVLCGQKEMTEQTIEMLENAGVPRERILMNF
jgi:ferredoxin-NADP reductase